MSERLHQYQQIVRDGLFTVFYFEYVTRQHKHVNFSTWIQKPRLTQAQKTELKAYDAHCQWLVEAEAALVEA